MASDKVELPEDINAALERLKAANPDSASEFESLVRGLVNKMERTQSERIDLSSALFMQRPSGYVD